jgi:hypothetical protein
MFIVENQKIPEKNLSQLINSLLRVSPRFSALLRDFQISHYDGINTMFIVENQKIPEKTCHS